MTNIQKGIPCIGSVSERSDLYAGFILYAAESVIKELQYSVEFLRFCENQNWDILKFPSCIFYGPDNTLDNVEVLKMFFISKGIDCSDVKVMPREDWVELVDHDLCGI